MLLAAVVLTPQRLTEAERCLRRGRHTAGAPLVYANAISEPRGARRVLAAMQSYHDRSGQTLAF